MWSTVEENYLIMLVRLMRSLGVFRALFLELCSLFLVLRSSIFDLWTLDFGLWTLDFGLWTLDNTKLKAPSSKFVFRYSAPLVSPDASAFAAPACLPLRAAASPTPRLAVH